MKGILLKGFLLVSNNSDRILVKFLSHLYINTNTWYGLVEKIAFHCWKLPRIDKISCTINHHYNFRDFLSKFNTANFEETSPSHTTREQTLRTIHKHLVFMSHGVAWQFSLGGRTYWVALCTWPWSSLATTSCGKTRQELVEVCELKHSIIS